jgi:hypothetical protein
MLPTEAAREILQNSQALNGFELRKSTHISKTLLQACCSGKGFPPFKSSMALAVRQISVSMFFVITEITRPVKMKTAVERPVSKISRVLS